MGPGTRHGAQSATPGLATSLRRFASGLAGVFHTRVELFALELERERLRLARALLLIAAAMFFLLLGALAFSAFIITAFWDSHRLAAMGGLAVLYSCIGAGIGFYVRQESARRARLFASTRAELRKDRDYLSGE